MEAARQRDTGKTATLVAEVEAHRAELTFDFRHTLGLSINDIGESIPWDEACDLVEQLADHPGTHYWSKLRGFASPTSWADVSQRLLSMAVLNMFRPKGADPTKIPLPWSDSEEQPDLTPEERDVLIDYARATAPFPLDD